MIIHGSPKEDRPKQSNLEHTCELANGMIFHYTCTSLTKKVLKRFGIIPVGEKFNRAPEEVLLIPMELYNKEGYLVKEYFDNDNLKIMSEQLLRDIKSKYNHNHY